jgi:hypothetical protein
MIRPFMRGHHLTIGTMGMMGMMGRLVGYRVQSWTAPGRDLMAANGASASARRSPRCFVPAAGDRQTRGSTLAPSSRTNCAPS